MDFAQKFRIYYNNTLYPELWRLEQVRHRALIQLFIGGGLALVFLVAEFALSVPFLNFIFLGCAIGFIAYVFLQLGKYRATFKPRVVGLLLDFLDEQPTYNELKYDQNRFIPEALFVRSQIFGGPYQIYEGEDLIYGKIGEMPFSLCELNVETESPMRSKTDVIFRGVFLYSKSHIANKGDILIMPRSRRELLAPFIEDFIKAGGRNIDADMKSIAFTRQFAVFASSEAWIDDRFSAEMEADLLSYQARTGKDIAMSFVGSEIFIALWQDKDMLEPLLFRNNNSFSLVEEYFEELNMLFQMVLDLDKSN